MHHITRLFLILAVLTHFAALKSAGAQESASPRPPAGYATSGDAEAKAAFMQGPGWRRLLRSFDDWLSVQNIYTEAEIAAIKTELQARVASMSVTELEDFQSDMQERLNVLLSDEAADARAHLSFFNPQARRQRIAPSGQAPQVLDMSVSELRQELRQFQQQRQQQAAAHSAFRQAQSQSTANVIQQQQTRQAQQQRSIAQSREQLAASASQQPQQPRQKPHSNIRSPYSLSPPYVTAESFARFEINRGIYGF